MSVPADKRAHGQLEVNTKARDLAQYTLIITANEKHFSPEQKSYTDMLRSTAIEIYTMCWEANNIVICSDEQRNERRLYLQGIAADKCNTMCALIELAKPLYHLSSKRVTYWMNKVVTVRNLIRAWHDSDVKRIAKATR